MTHQPTLKTVSALLPYRRGIGDQPLVDWLDVVRLAQSMEIGRPGYFVSVRQLMAAWGCAQCSVSRRIKAINLASCTLSTWGATADGAQMGRVVRVYRAPGFWRVVFNPSTES